MNYLTSNELKAWLDEISRQLTLLAPHWAANEEIAWDYQRTLLPVKELFFPPTETLFEIERHDHEIRLVEPAPPEPQVVFGVRPCDGRGLQVLDAMFIDTPPADPYYQARRRMATLVGLACDESGPDCFCTSMGGAPDDASGMDLMLYPLDGGYILEIISPAGRKFAERFPLPGSSRHSGARQRKPSRPELEVVAPESGRWHELFHHSLWEDTASRCLNCRLCAYVCPTCRCFDIRDEPVPASDNGSTRFERLRCWDSCAGEPYRRIAGGHNPRPEKTERLRNRLFCKFLYYPEQYGPQACTGCGRCIEVCPVNIDIAEILATLAKVTS
jgi:sulfhydrogenase subunit beta (sulfur reductase)